MNTLLPPTSRPTSDMIRCVTCRLRFAQVEGWLRHRDSGLCARVRVQFSTNARPAGGTAGPVAELLGSAARGSSSPAVGPAEFATKRNDPPRFASEASAVGHLPTRSMT